MIATDYGYVRVSAKDQNEARQIQAMLDFGIQRQNIFVDKQSGKDFNRPKYKRIIRLLKRRYSGNSEYRSSRTKL